MTKDWNQILNSALWSRLTTPLRIKKEPRTFLLWQFLFSSEFVISIFLPPLLCSQLLDCNFLGDLQGLSVSPQTSLPLPNGAKRDYKSKEFPVITETPTRFWCFVSWVAIRVTIQEGHKRPGYTIIQHGPAVKKSSLCHFIIVILRFHKL